jgi:pyrimidine operon attenuation protein/uracil phosphoribosyltransferase
MKVQILTHQQVSPILKRIAYQILESNSKAKEICLVHIEGQGKALADILENELHAITSQRIVRAGIQIDKKNPQLSSAVVNGTFNPSANSALVIVDDVLNSGKTMMCALSVCFSKGFNQIQLAVLVDRSYKHFPLQANFIGTSLSTTLQEHINVQCRAGKISVYVE